MLNLVLAAVADAHTRSESHSNWTVNGKAVDVIFSVSEIETARLAADGQRPTDQQFLAYLRSRLGVSSGGRPCEAPATEKVLSATSGYRRAEFQFECSSNQSLTLADHAFFDLVPTHVNFAQIQAAGAGFSEQLFQSKNQTIPVETARDQKMHSAGLWQFISMGISHIFTGIDHMSFLLGLVLISRRLRDLIFVVTGFTLGHSLTLALAVTGVIRPHAEFIDALVALTIALIGLENIAIASRRPGIVALATGGTLLLLAGLRTVGVGVLPPLLLLGAALFSANYLMVSGYVRDAGRLRFLVTLVFGLIHGFGFAADLLDSRLPTAKLAQILVGFNLGVEIGQLSVVLILVGVATLLVRVRLALPRRLTVDLAASALVAVGLFWFLGRSL